MCMSTLFKTGHIQMAVKLFYYITCMFWSLGLLTRKRWQKQATGSPVS